MPKLQIRPDKRGDPYIRLVGDNNEVVMTSESYSSWSTARAMAPRIKQIMAEAEVVEDREPD